MVAKRIIPCLDIKDGRVVKGINFINLRDAGDPVENAKIYQQEGADELAFLDISASSQKRKTVIELVRKVSKAVSMPFTVGGGIKSIENIREVLSAGADKVSINTAAVENKDLIKKASAVFGSQCIVVAIDAKLQKSKPKGQVLGKEESDALEDNSKKSFKWEVYIQGGSIATGIDVIDWSKKVESLGAGEILLTSVDYDGTRKGFDLELIKEVSQKVSIPVIASGGAGSIDHFSQVFKQTKATAALAASIFHYREVAIGDIKKQLAHEGIEVRL